MITFLIYFQITYNQGYKAAGRSKADKNNKVANLFRKSALKNIVLSYCKESHLSLSTNNHKLRAIHYKLCKILLKLIKTTLNMICMCINK